MGSIELSAEFFKEHLSFNASCGRMAAEMNSADAAVASAAVVAQQRGLESVHTNTHEGKNRDSCTPSVSHNIPFFFCRAKTKYSL